MKISTKGRYGLRVMMELAGHYNQGPVPVGAIAHSQGISDKYIYLLVMVLKSSGLVNTVRGPKGGLALTRHPSLITACDVISALEGESAPVNCVLNASLCSRADNCAVRDVWCDVAAAMKEVLSGLTLEQLSARQRDKCASFQN